MHKNCSGHAHSTTDLLFWFGTSAIWHQCNSLQNSAFPTAYLKQRLISLVWGDTASTIQLFLHDFPTIIVGVCACNILELGVYDAVDAVHQNNVTTICVRSLHCQLLMSSQCNLSKVGCLKLINCTIKMDVLKSSVVHFCWRMMMIQVTSPLWETRGDVQGNMT